MCFERREHQLLRVEARERRDPGQRQRSQQEQRRGESGGVAERDDQAVEIDFVIVGPEAPLSLGLPEYVDDPHYDLRYHLLLQLIIVLL